MFTSGVEARKHGCSERNPLLLCFRNQIMQCDYTHIVPQTTGLPPKKSQETATLRSP